MSKCRLDPTIMPGDTKLILRLFRRGLLDQLLLGTTLFAAAWTFRFWQAWAFLIAQAGVSVCSCVYFYRHDPQVLERRLLKKEKMISQRLILGGWRVLAGISLLLAGEDHRLGWSGAFLEPVPTWLVLLSLLIVLSGHILVFQVLKVNRFAASVIQVEGSQTVATTGLYRIVRHPMYLGFAVMWLFTPLALGSFVAEPVCALIIPCIMLRLLNEEKFLRRDLPGYGEYCQQTRRRLIPFVW